MLDNKVVVVAGGAGLLGREFARAIAQHGGAAVIADSATDPGKHSAEALRAELSSDKIVFEPLDVTSKDSLGKVLRNVTARFGKIDALVNCAYPKGPNYGRKLEDVEYDDFCASINLHLGGYFLSSQQFALFFRDQGFGNIINIASIYGVIAPRFDIYAETAMTMPVEYAVIKSAIIHLNTYLMRYFKGHPLRFNCISPGGILEAQPEAFLRKYNAYAQTKGMLAVGDMTGALLFLLSDDSRYVNGQNLIVDDGFSV